MSCDDGLVMTLHPGVRRNHHAPTAARFGPDTGPRHPGRGRVHRRAAAAARALRHRTRRSTWCSSPSTRRVFSREIAPLAGFYPSVYVGRALVVPRRAGRDPALARRRSPRPSASPGPRGFIDDTRAFCSIPARHDMSRRLDAGYLAGLVAEHRLDEDEAAETAVELVTDNPRRAFKL